MSHRHTLYALWFLLFLLAVLVYRPGLNGAFEFDDIPNIIVNQSLVIKDFSLQSLKDIALSRASTGGSGRSISFLSFALNVNTTGLDPFYFKLTNLLIHLFNGLLVFIFSKYLLTYGNLTRKTLPANTIDLLALGIAALWLVHPIQLNSVLYIVQRMTSLSALFLLLAFIAYIKGRLFSLRHGLGMPITVLVVSVLTVMAVFSKENGALAPLFLIIIEIFVFKFSTRKRLDLLLLVGFFVLTIGLLIHFVLPDMPVSRWSETVSGRHFSIAQRLYTEITVIWLYLSLILTPMTEHFAIYHDYWPVSTSLWQPFNTLLSLIALLGSLLLGFIFRRKYPFLLFAMLWFLAGHFMESTFIPLELIHEHRNYLPSVGILLGLVIFMFQLKNIRLVALLYLLLFTVFAWTTYERSVEWSSEMRHAIAEVKNHPDSARANYQLGRVMYYAYKRRALEASYMSSSQFFLNAIELSDYNLNAYIGHFILDGEAKKPLNRKLYQAFLKRLEYAPIRSQSLAYFETLSNCQMEQRCPFSHEQFMAIFTAISRNKQVAGSLAAKLADIYYHYMNWYQRNHLPEKLTRH